MTCDKTKESYADYLTGDMDDEIRRNVRNHIAGCAACREDLENLTLIWAKLGVLPEEQPGPGLRDRFYAMLEEHMAALVTADGQAGHPAAKQPETMRTGIEKPSPARAGSSRTSQGFHVPDFRAWFIFQRPAFVAAFSTGLLLLGIGAGWFLAGGRADARNLARLSTEVQDMRQQVALSLLGQPSAADRLLGISYSTAVEKPDDRTLEALFEALDHDPNPNVRLAAVEALYLFRNKPGVRESLVRSLAVQSYPLVQVALIDFLVDIREERAVEALKRLLEDDDLVNPEVRKRAEQGLKQII